MLGARIVFLTAILALSAKAQGTVLFIWHGDSNFFQASFQTYYYEIAPGTNFSSDLFLSSMAVTNPLGQTYHGGDSSSGGSGSFIPWGLNFQLNNFQRSTELVIEGGFILGSPYRTAGIIWEQVMSAPDDLWFERGYWSVQQIPEPAVGSLAVVAAVTVFVSRRKYR